MNRMNHSINNRNLTTFNPLEEELQLQSGKNYLFDLSHLAVLDVVGDKAIEFLQGQLTCDVSTISDIQMIQGGQCNLQGRLLALMDVISWSGVKLVLPQDLMEASIKSLSKTAMLSRVKLEENKRLRVLGFYLQNPQDLVVDSHFFPESLYALTFGKDYCCYHLGANFYIFLVEQELAEQLFERFQEQQQLVGSLTWHTLRLQQGQFDIYPESRGMFLPHRLDLHQTSFISFNKGCYKGQEIIARMHYKATLKHELGIYAVEVSGKLFSGQKVFNEPAKTEAGELIDYSPIGENQYVVAVSLMKNSGDSVYFEGCDEIVQLK